ncbi:restriction endonuclease subunit S [Aeromonas veronii]
MTQEKRVPEIRFEGFSRDWQDAMLSDVIDVRSGKDYKHLGKGNIPVYGTGGYMLSVDSALSNDEDAIGIGRKGTIDKPYLLRAPFWTVDTLFYAVPRPKFKLDYLYCLFQKIDWKKHDESTGVPSLSKVAINNIPVKVTCETEQTAIGNTFQKLNNLIDQHQQKHDKLKNIKKAMLEKMFPKQGEATPEIRFKGFSGEWEEVALGEYAIFTKGQGYSKSDLSDSGTPIILYGRLYTKYQTVIDQVDTFAIEKSKSVKSVGNEVIVPASGESSEDIARASAVCESGVILGGDLNIIYPNDKINPVFLALVISNGYPQKALASKAQGKSVVHIRNRDLAALLFTMPKKEEQTAIGNYFQKLDMLINQHQQQITKLNNIKQACLRKMFV